MSTCTRCNQAEAVTTDHFGEFCTTCRGTRIQPYGAFELPEAVLINPKRLLADEDLADQRTEDLEVPRLLATMQRRHLENNELRSQLRAARTEDIDVNDDRLNYIWAEAYEFAAERGYCSQFESVMNALGIEWRPQTEVVVDLTVTVPVRVTLTLNGRVDDDTIDAMLEDMSIADEVRREVRDYELDYTIDSWEEA